MSRKLMKLRLCYSYVICNSVIDDLTVPVGDETTGHQWIPVARDHWSGTLMVQCAVIPLQYPVHKISNTRANKIRPKTTICNAKELLQLRKSIAISSANYLNDHPCQILVNQM